MCLHAYEVALRFTSVISLTSKIDTYGPTPPHPQLYQLVFWQTPDIPDSQHPPTISKMRTVYVNITCSYSTSWKKRSF